VQAKNSEHEVRWQIRDLMTRADRMGHGQTFKTAVLKVVKQDGIAGLYDGLTSSLLGIAITNGIYYLL
jgi:hypothetical protein